MSRHLPLLLILGAAACRGQADGAVPAEERPLQVGRENVVVAAVGAIRSGPAISGTLAAERSATLRAEVGGEVTQVLAEQGQAVSPGQPLIRLDDSAIRDGYEAARTALQAAELSADLARRNAERSEALVQAGAIADRELENARFAQSTAEAQVASARTQLATAEKQLAKTVLRAPFAGVVSERPANVGDIVQAGTVLITVVDPDRLKLEAAVPADRLDQLKTGTDVEFTVSGVTGKTFRGRVARINPAVDPATRQIRITVAVPNPGRNLVIGLFAEGRVALETRQAVSLPASAVDERGVTPVVYRLKASRVEKVPVTLGLRDQIAERVEIAEGVSPGDTLLLGSAQGISEGAVVRVVGE